MSNFSKTHKKINKELKSHKEHVDDKGRSVIDVTIYNDDEFLSPYSSNSKVIISEETANFLEHSAMVVSPKKPLHFIFHSNTIDKNEQSIYPNAIKNYYFNQLVDIQRRLTSNTIISLMFTLASIITFVLQFYVVDILMNIATISELVNVIGWVFMWEAVDQFCIQRSKLNRRKYRYLNIMEATFTFEKLNNK